MAEYEQHNQLDYRLGGDTIDDFAQKYMAETTRIFRFLNDLKQNKINGTEYTEPSPGQLNVEDGKIYIRNEANDKWLLLGKLDENFGFKPADADFISSDELSHEKIAEVNNADLINILGKQDISIPGRGMVTNEPQKLVQTNEDGVLPVDILGNAAKLAGYRVETDIIQDGQVMTFRAATQTWHNENKGVIGSGKALNLYDGETLLCSYAGDTPQDFDLGITANKKFAEDTAKDNADYVRDMVNDKVDKFEVAIEISAHNNSASAHANGLESPLKRWYAGKSYAPDNIVVQDKRIWMCVTANSDAEFDKTKWQSIGGGDDSTGGIISFVRKRRIIRDGGTARLYWSEPKDTEFSQWAKTIIVKKEGSYPESILDGIEVTVNTVRDQYYETPFVDSNGDGYFYRAFPVSATGATSVHTLNRFGFWHYGLYIDREDGDENTCVHYLDGYDNQGYERLKMRFEANVENNALDWGDWKHAQFMPRPCALRHSGTVDYYLDENDYNKKANGSANTNLADVNYDGEMMMEWSPVFVKVESTPTKHYMYFCSEKYDENYECYSCLKADGGYGDHFYLPIYEGRVVNSVMRSLSTGVDGANGAVPTSSTTMDAEMTYAKANGTGWNITTWADEQLVAALGILVMGRLNSAVAVGYNCGSSTSALTHRIGTANKKGMFFGHYTTSAYATKFFGMENWWGHRWRRCVGMMTSEYEMLVKLTKSTADGSTVEGYNSTGAGYIRTGLTVPGMSASYITDIHNNKRAIIAPLATSKYKGDGSTAGGSASTYYCDAGWSSGSLRALFSGGYVNNGANGGLFAFHVTDAPSYSYWTVGASLSFRTF